MSKTTKQAQIIETLSTKEGASIDEMMKLTGWQKHTVRGVLSRVIKKLEGFELSSEKQDADRRYYLKPTEEKGNPNMSNQNPIINNAIQANMNAMRDMLEKAATLQKRAAVTWMTVIITLPSAPSLTLIGCLAMPKPYTKRHSPSTGSEASPCRQGDLFQQP